MSEPTKAEPMTDRQCRILLMVLRKIQIASADDLFVLPLDTVREACGDAANLIESLQRDLASLTLTCETLRQQVDAARKDTDQCRTLTAPFQESFEVGHVQQTETVIARVTALEVALRQFVECDGIVNYDSHLCWGCGKDKYEPEDCSLGCVLRQARALLSKESV